MKRQNNNNQTRMTREAFRRRKKPFYKKKAFLISIFLILIILIGLFVIWRTNANDNDNKQTDHKIEKVKPQKKTKKKKTPKKAEKTKKVTKEQPEQKVQKQEEPKQQPAQIKNAGTYNDLVYDTDWYTFKISNEVKLIKDANGDAALMVKYNYTNKTNNTEIPQKVQNNAIMLKQNDKQLSSTTATGDNAAIINASNNGQVLPGKTFDGALLVKVDDTTSEVTMYFKNIQTNAWLDSTQSLKLE